MVGRSEGGMPRCAAGAVMSSQHGPHCAHIPLSTLQNRSLFSAPSLQQAACGPGAKELPTEQEQQRFSWSSRPWQCARSAPDRAERPCRPRRCAGRLQRQLGAARAAVPPQHALRRPGFGRSARSSSVARARAPVASTAPPPPSWRWRRRRRSAAWTPQPAEMAPGAPPPCCWARQPWQREQWPRRGRYPARCRRWRRAPCSR